MVISPINIHPDYVKFYFSVFCPIFSFLMTPQTYLHIFLILEKYIRGTSAIDFKYLDNLITPWNTRTILLESSNISKNILANVFPF